MVFYDVTNYGAKGDGITDSTNGFALAIEACANNGGGTVYIPAGSYTTGPIVLRSNITLYAAAGANIFFKDEFDLYTPVKTRWSGYECYGYSPLIFGENLQNVAIKGEGCFDGKGRAWWEINEKLKQGESYFTEVTKELANRNTSVIGAENTNIVEWDSQFLRPPLLQLIGCENVTIEGITLQNSPFWNTHLVYCNHVFIRGASIKNPSDTPNGDGLDIDSCTNVTVSDCHFDVGDDCLCLKSGINEDGRRVGKPTENVTVTNCIMLHGHGGVVMGSENSGGIRNVTVSNCQFLGTDRGIRLKTNRSRGAYIENIMINNIFMEDVLCPIAINSFYRYGVDVEDPTMNSLEPQPITEKTPKLKNIHLSNITAKNCRAAAAFIYGLPEMPVEDIMFSNVSLEMSQDPQNEGGEPDMVKEMVVMAGEGLYCRYVKGLTFQNLNVEPRQGPAVALEDVMDVEIQSVKMSNENERTSVVTLKRVESALIQDVRASLNENYLEVDNSSHIFLNGKELVGGL